MGNVLITMQDVFVFLWRGSVILFISLFILGILGSQGSSSPFVGKCLAV
jgi:hypothetical protein